MRARMNKIERRDQIMGHAIRLARKVGYMNVRRDELARNAGVANGLVSNHWNTMVQLKKAIIREAIRIEDAVIVGQGLALRDRHAMKAPQHLKEKAIAQIGV